MSTSSEAGPSLTTMTVAAGRGTSTVLTGRG